MHPKTPKKIPTLIALLLLAVIISSTIYIADNAVTLFSKATQQSENIQPQQVTITNLTDTSATIFWKTVQPITGTVQVTLSSKEKKVYLDARDTDGLSKSYTIHYVELSGLPSSQAVNITILSGKQPYSQNSLQLLPTIAKPPQALPIYGDIPTDATFESTTGIILATMENSLPISVLVNSKQTFALPLAKLRTRDGTNYYCKFNDCTDTAKVKLQFIGSTTLNKETILRSARPLQNEPLIDTQETTTLSPQPTQAEKIKGASISKVSSPSVKRVTTPTPTINKLGKNETDFEIKIVAPYEGASFSFSKPLIRGTGIPNKKVTLTLDGVFTQIGKTEISSPGTWQWTPQYPLSAGNYKLKIETLDKNNNKAVLVRNFNILKSGEKVLSDSTPSATLIPTLPILSPTPTSSYVITSTPSPLPTTGAELPSLLFIGAGLLLLVFSLTLL